MAVPSGLWPEAGAPVIAAVGAALLTVRSKEVRSVRLPSSLAVTNTVIGPPGPSGGVYDQVQMPEASSLATEPTSVTVPLPSGSQKKPCMTAGEPSSAGKRPENAITNGISLTLVIVTVKVFS